MYVHTDVEYEFFPVSEPLRMSCLHCCFLQTVRQTNTYSEFTPCRQTTSNKGTCISQQAVREGFTVFYVLSYFLLCIFDILSE